MYRFLVRPRWLLLHLLAGGAVILMINLAFWQLHRLDQRQAFNSLVRSNSSTAVSSFESVVTTATDPYSVEWRPVIITGSYLLGDAITVVNKSQNGTSGVDSVVPLRTASGITVLINRGFIPLAQSVPAPTTSTVSVTGFLRRSQTRSFGGAIDASGGVVVEWQRIDIPRIDAQFDGDLAPMYIQRFDSTPPEGDWPARVINPTLDNGPHLSYAGQWFFFSASVIGGWIFVIRRKIQSDKNPKQNQQFG
ncbi:MAG: SURF1 family protein [Ilumatobacteraceae bacterium]|nr:SURF1 family protein [Ilumatobacteraceae bacterium]